jgi:GNAT superfamily N-acetyltransferase
VTLATHADARELLARVFASDALAAEYPTVLGPEAAGGPFELVEDGELRAACTLLVREFRVGPLTLRGGLIGSVATEPAVRGRGFGTRLLAAAERELAARSCAFALLWANEPRFYLARGYAPFGVECDVMLVPELAAALPAPTGVRALCASDAPAVHALYLRHPVRVERSAAETRALLGVPGMATLVRERAANPAQPPEVVAYACLGRGRDLGDVVHEWGGEPEDVLALLRAHLEARAAAGNGAPLFWMAPSGANELLYRLLALGAPSQRGILGLGKLLDLGAATRALAAALGDEAEVHATASGATLRGPRAGVELDAEALQALLFGGPDVHAEAQALLARLGFARARLPLEPFAFGLDSI